MLKQNEYLWAVTFISRDDGHTCEAFVFSDMDQASQYVREHRSQLGDDPRVVQTTLWQDTETKKFYRLSMTEVKVDEPIIRQRALARLSQEERDVLRIK